jgi:hypothetical protein
MCTLGQKNRDSPLLKFSRERPAGRERTGAAAADESALWL